MKSHVTPVISTVGMVLSRSASRYTGCPIPTVERPPDFLDAGRQLVRRDVVVGDGPEGHLRFRRGLSSRQRRNARGDEHKRHQAGECPQRDSVENCRHICGGYPSAGLSHVDKRVKDLFILYTLPPEFPTRAGRGGSVVNYAWPRAATHGDENIRTGARWRSMDTLGRERRPIVLLGEPTQFFKLVRSADMDPGKAPESPRGKV